jgi:GH25 family lysozyme M1 (1,4-beta-N-acetylmuramidase)
VAAPSLRCRKDAGRLAVILAAALALAAPVLAGTPAGAEVSAAAAGRSAPPPGRYNVGATHSPQLLSQLAGSSRAAALTGSAERAAMLAPPAAVAGDEQGVDVASFQHRKTTQYPGGAPISWSQVAASGVGFASVKVTEGNYYRNPFALADLAGAEQAGLDVAAYAFAVPDGNGRRGSTSPVLQADYLLSQLGGYASTVPLMLDIEYDPYVSSDHTNECYGLSRAAMVTWITAFAGEIQARTGRQPIIYTPPSWWSTCTGNSTAFSGDPLWVPDFSSSGSPSSTASWADWSFWQYGSTGTVPGIDSAGATDLDQANPAVLALLDPASRRQPDGAPVTLRVQPALPPAGPAATFQATGLPPGLSVTPGGTITGWLAQTGTYHVQATATSSTGAAGTVPFTWTVTAPPGGGPTGEVRSGAAGQCLTAGDNAAHGAPAELWSCNGSAPQRWTVAADRTLRSHGKCLSVSGSAAVNGARVVLAACSGDASQHWVVGTGGRLVNGAAGKCLAGSPGGRNGSRAWISSCTGNVRQMWALPSGDLLSQIPGRCAAGQGGSASSNPVVLSRCGTGTGQQWAAEPDRTIRVAGRCLGVTRRAGRSRVTVSPCRGRATQHWRIVPDGAGLQVRNASAGLCLSDPGDSTVSGTSLVLGACTASDPGTGWRLP